MIVDLLVIGGGINGCGIAADAAGRGLSVMLCEKDDLAFATSSSSSKLIHGGLRYLEQYAFGMVREALKERETLMAKAPFLIRPIDFVLPHNKQLRPVFMIRLGLFLYDHLFRKQQLPRSKKLNLQKAAEGKPLRSEYKVGFRYSDCWTDDARLVVLNALAAREKGARILTQTECLSAERDGDYWVVQLHDKLRDKTFTVKAKALVNAAGPWVTEVINKINKIHSTSSIRLVQGSHFIVRKLYEGSQAYTLQNPDGRVVFAIPFKKKFTLIGTTDVDYEGDPNMAAITNAEIDYLCSTINRYFSKSISEEDIIWSYSGVRPLYNNHANNAAKTTREHHLELDVLHKKTPLISIFGGKITSYRTLSEAVLKKLKPYLPKMEKAWTAKEKLPGGHCDGLSYTDFVTALEKKYHWLPTHITHRYAKLYGDLCHAFLADCQSLEDLGQYFGAGLYEKEILYLIKNEWAQTTDDILWRRTKLGLYLTEDEVKVLKNYLEE